jgi:hypothetical protein
MEFFMLETLFYKTYYAYLKGDIESAKLFFDFLREEFKLNKSEKTLPVHHLRILKDIRKAIDSGETNPLLWVPEQNLRIEPTSEESDIKQNALVKKIHQEALKSLRTLLNSDNSLYLANIEHPCGKYGRIDMLYQNKDTAYPIEIKKDQGRHDLIGQIDKYTLYFKMLLHLNHFKYVQPVTICGSYDPLTLTELKRRAVIPIKYFLVNDSVSLNMV